MTRAAPKVADYPFTTVEPVLGTIDFDDRQIVLADIPGLIEGAAGGAGLGHEFLAHVERCRLLVHLVEIEPAEGDPESNYEAVRGELASYGHGLAGLPEIVALSKADLVPEERATELVAEWKQRLGTSVAGVVAISSATNAGLDDLRRAIATRLPEGDRGEGVPGAPVSTAFEAEHRVYTPGAGEGFEVVAEGDGRWRITGKGIEILFARHDLSNPEALDYLEQRLREIGVLAELQRAGFEAGDDVLIGDVELELTP
jgi:GTP-binding protein